MKILIAGSNSNTYLLAEFMHLTGGHDIYITSDVQPESGAYTALNIKENDISALADFAENNDIDFTIAFSQLAAINGIADEFNKKGLAIAVPSSEAARAVFFNSTAKKLMYKLKINTPRFGIFDRENIAADYLRHAKYPAAIMNDFTLNERINRVCRSYKQARTALREIFENRNEKIIIQNYIDEKPIYIYFLTDGCNAAPLAAIDREEYENFTLAAAPSGRIDEKTINDIMNKAVFPFLDDTAASAGGYSGILGMKVKLQGGHFYILEFYNNFESCDLQALLSVIGEDITELFYYAAVKQLRTRSSIYLQDKTSCTAAVKSEFINTEAAAADDFFISQNGGYTVITKAAASKGYALKELKEYLKEVCCSKLYEEIQKNTEKALRI